MQEISECLPDGQQAEPFVTVRTAEDIGEIDILLVSEAYGKINIELSVALGISKE